MMSNDKTKVIARVYLVRHGETQENREGVIQGQRDTLLNATGEKQAEMLGERFREVKVDWAVSSDLLRAVKTAEAVVGYHEDVVLELDRALRERKMGDLEGYKLSERAGLPGEAKGVESSVEFRARTVRWWRERVLGHFLSQKESEGRVITGVVTTHGGFITTLVRELLSSRKAVGCVDKMKCRNASVTVIDILSNRKAVIVCFGDVTHLDSEECQESLESNADQIQYT